MKKPNRAEKRRKAKEAAEQGHTVNTPPPQPPAALAQRSSIVSALFSSTWGMFWSGVVAFGTVLGIVTGLYFFAPQLSATPSTTLIEADPMSTYFIIANEGNLDLHDVGFSCSINYATDGKAIHIAKTETNLIPVFRRLFPAKDKIGLPCLTFIKLHHLAKADISIRVQFRPSFWPLRKSWESRFKTHAGDNGKLYWMPETGAFVFDPTKPPPSN